MQTAQKEGMTRLNSQLAKFVKDDIVEPSEAYAKAVDKDGLLKEFEVNGITGFKPPEDG